MWFLYLAGGFALLMLGLALFFSIPYLVALADKKSEEAEIQNIQTQVFVNRYNSQMATPKSKRPAKTTSNVIQFRKPTNGDGENNKDN